jgi:HEPN domain-containing protein
MLSLADVLRLPIHNLIASSSNVAMLADNFARMLEERESEYALVHRPILMLRASVDEILGLAEQAGMVVAYASAKRCAARLAQLRPEGPAFRLTDAQVRMMVFDLQNITQSVTDELEFRKVYLLPSRSAALVDLDAPIVDAAVEASFPLAMEDLREAAQCLAFERYTAAVFHLMRTMESSVRALASSVGVTQVDKEWGKLLSDISKAIEAMPKGDLRNRWSESHSLLYHVKQAWRNDTMHPKSTYTEAEARAVLDAVKSFMTHLARLI